MKSCSGRHARRCGERCLPMWRLEVESLLVLKNNRECGRQPRAPYGLRGTDQQTDVYHLLKGEDITLFSPSDVPGLSRRILRRSRKSLNACIPDAGERRTASASSV
ncbi:hypothetical protein ACLBOM_14225 [Escherichia coli]